MHFAGHSLTHFMQLMQPTSQTSETALPLSSDEHRTMTLAACGTICMTWLGQVETQVPQAVHFSVMTWTMPWAMYMASKGQARMQSPRPMQE
jgi:tetrahydromethanopterin S-methyltransferase subunit C